MLVCVGFWGASGGRRKYRNLTAHVLYEALARVEVNEQRHHSPNLEYQVLVRRRTPREHAGRALIGGAEHALGAALQPAEAGAVDVARRRAVLEQGGEARAARPSARERAAIDDAERAVRVEHDLVVALEAAERPPTRVVRDLGKRKKTSGSEEKRSKRRDDRIEVKV